MSLLSNIDRNAILIRLRNFSSQWSYTMSIEALPRNTARNTPRKFDPKRFVAMALTALGCLSAPALLAQSYVPPVVSTVATTLFSNGATSMGPGQVAIDKAGNVFYINHISPYTLYEIPHSAPAVITTTPVALITGLGQYNSNGLFVDPKGDLWIANGNGTDGLYMIPATSAGIPNTASTNNVATTAITTACTTTVTVACFYADGTFATNITNSYVQPSSLYVDGSGNVYFVDYYDGVSSGHYNRVVMFNTATPATGTLLVDNLTSNSDATIALDGAGKLYYADSITGNSGGGKVSLVSGSALTTVGTTATLTSAQIASATGVASDSYGNLYISSTTQVSEVPYEATALNFADEFGLISGLSNTVTYGGNLDAYGNFYYGSYTNIMQLQVNGYNFGSVSVGNLVSSSTTPAAPSITVYFNAAESSVSSYFPTGSPTSNTLSQYLQSFPYSGTKSFGGGTSFAIAATGTITMNFQPIHPGLLKGSFTPRSGGADDAVINLQGVGTGPEPLFFPGTPSQLFNASTTKALSAPEGVTVDTYGDIFVADTGNAKVVADCLSTSTVTTAGSGSGGATNSFCGNSGYLGLVVQLGTGFTTPAAIALDGANNLYVVDTGANSVTIINGVGLTSTTPVTSTTTFGGTKLSGPKGIAVDGYTNIYIADTGNNRIVQAHQYGATNTDNVVYIPSTTTFGTLKLSGPTGLAVDGAGDLFIADTGNNRIVEYTPLGVASVLSTGTLTLNTPTSVAVYPSGALVVADKTYGVSLINGTSSAALSFGSTYTTASAQGVALDLAGNIYLSNTSGNQVLELNVTSPQTLPAFPNTNDGSVSTATTTQVADLGNASLVLSGLVVSTTNYTDTSASTCTTTSTVTAGSSCNILTEFTPGATATPGTLTGSVTLTDNQLGYTLNTTTSDETATFGTSGTQALNLTGTAVAAGGTGTTPQTITFPTIAPVTYSTSLATTGIPLSATAAPSGLPIFFGVTSSTPTGIASVNSTGTALLVTGAGTVTVQATQPGNATYAPATPVSQTITINPAAQALTFTLSSPVTYSTGLTIPLSATSSVGTAGGAITFSVPTGNTVASVSGNTLTILSAGTIVVTANQVATANYSAATPVTQTFVINQAAQTITFPAPPSPVVLGTGTVTLTATASSGLAVTFSITSGGTIASLSGSTLTFTGTGTVVVAANQAGNTNFAAAPTVSQSIVVNPPPDFSLAISPGTLSVSPGEAGTVAVTVTGINSYTGTTSFSCSGLLPAAYCGFAPSTITGTNTTTLTIYVPLGASVRNPFGPMVPGVTFALALCMFGFRKRRRLQMLLLAVISVVSLSMLSGCGSSTPAAAPITSTIIVTGTSGTLVHTASFTLTVP